MKDPLALLKAVMRWERPRPESLPDTREPEITLLTAEQRRMAETIDRLRAQGEVPQESRQPWT